MSTKPIILSTLLVLLGLGAARGQDRDLAQDPKYQPDLGDRRTAPQPELDPKPPTQIYPPQTGPSTWIVYRENPNCECCGPIGGCGPIRMELFAGTGPSLAIGGTLIESTLSDGWLVEGGGRSLFFNQDLTAAWNIDLKLSYVGNSSSSSISYPFLAPRTDPITGRRFVVTDQVTTAALHRTYVSLGLGREWFLPGPTLMGQSNFIFGVDGGARYGVVRLDVHNYNIVGQFQRTTDILWGGYGGVHFDWEIPRGCCTCILGFRTEFGYSKFEVPITLPQQHIYDLNFMLNAGVRF